ncbi:axin-2 isoform X2 [Kogia breviceps]|uniref:axin-2 isoform X2 n=1 Tax=Kogia breviceps TaxID=27615 RepID=UPI0034D25522
MSSAVLVPRLPDPSSSFREDAPRPPVPGEEGETPPCQPGVGKGPVAKLLPVSSNARRNEDGLGEPEGRASPDSPLTRWTKSLHSLLGDQDGAYLFRTFLEREKCVDTLDFWFACNGFRQMNLKDAKTLRVAKAIYKRYIENNSIVSKQLKPATKTYIRDGIKKQQIDSVMFDQAQTEIQAVMEDNAYQMFLTSDIYLEYVRSGAENPACVSSGGLGSLKLVCGYLPTLNEEEEWTCADFKCKLSPAVVGLSSKTLRATVGVRSTETVENGYRRSDPVNPYHVGSGCVFAPAASANDSEVSSDALTDDSVSVTDGSVDGIPPYLGGSKKQLQREMHRSVKANGQVCLPHFPRTHRLPKEMTPVEPAAFAAELISRLEKLKLELETRHSLEERLQQIREDEEKEGSELALGAREAGPAQHPLSLLPSGSYEEDPQTILDDHLSRVLKTPGCQSPGVGRYSPRARSPDQHRRHHLLQHRAPPPPGGPAAAPAGCPLLGARGFVSRQTTKHVHHHYIHHHAGPRTREEVEAEAAPRARCPCPCPVPVPGGADYPCCAKCKSHPGVPEPAAAAQAGCCTASQQRDRHHSATGQPGAMPASSPSLALEDHREPKKLAGVHALQASELVVTYFFCGEEIPYRRMLKAQSLTLGHFKEQLSKKGNYRHKVKLITQVCPSRDSF